MNTFQFVVFILTIVSVICGEKRSSNEDVQLNQGEYFPSEEELKAFDEHYGYKPKTNRHFPQDHQEGGQFMIIKRTKQIPITRRVMIAHPPPGLTPLQHPKSVAYAAVHQTKIMPVKVIREGPIKHVYLPEYYNDHSAQIKSSRSSKAYENINQDYENINQASYNTPHFQFNGYNPGQYEQNYFRPSLQYNYLPHAVSGFSQGGLGHGYNAITSGYRAGKSNEITQLIPEYGSHLGYPIGLGNNFYPSAPQYLPQTFSSQVPSYQGGYTYQQIPQLATNVQQQNSYAISDQYKSLISGQPSNNAYTTSQSSQMQGFTPAAPINLVNNQNSNNSGREAKLAPASGLDPELANIVNEVLQGKGTSTHDGFTMIKSKTDNAIYLIGKPGMSLNTIPNFSAYNYASFQNDDKSAETKTEEKKST